MKAPQPASPLGPSGKILIWHWLPYARAVYAVAPNYYFGSCRQKFHLTPKCPHISNWKSSSWFLLHVFVVPSYIHISRFLKLYSDIDYKTSSHCLRLLTGYIQRKVGLSLKYRLTVFLSTAFPIKSKGRTEKPPISHPYPVFRQLAFIKDELYGLQNWKN